MLSILSEPEMTSWNWNKSLQEKTIIRFSPMQTKKALKWLQFPAQFQTLVYYGKQLWRPWKDIYAELWDSKNSAIGN